MRASRQRTKLGVAMSTQTLTLLFTDIVGSTELLARLDDRVRERLRTSHFAALREQIDRRRGTVAKTLGDGIMASFACARGALDSAVSIQQGMPHPVGDGGPRGLSVRIGVSSGDVHVVDEDCFGKPVVEASRLCDRARGGQILVADSTRLLVGGYEALGEVGTVELKGLPEPTRVWEVPWAAIRPAPLRVVLADDAILVREGIARVLEAAGIEVVGQAGDADELLRLTAELRPDLAIVDVRMPPSHTVEGLEAAERILTSYPATGVLVLTQEVEPRYATRILNASPSGVGYLLKERVANLHEFIDSARRVATGGVAFESDLVRSAKSAGHRNTLDVRQVVT